MAFQKSPRSADGGTPLAAGTLPADHPERDREEPFEAAYRCLNLNCQLPTVVFKADADPQPSCPFCGCKERVRVR